MKVFIVEDSKTMQSFLVKELTRIHGVQICGMAHETAEAVRCIHKAAPDMVILDIVINNGSEFEVIKQISREGKSPRVMVLSNYLLPHYKEMFMGMGVKLFFDKSRDLNKAIETVRGMVTS